MLLLLTALQESHGEAGGLTGPFVLEPGLIVWTWVVFIALFLLLRKFAWPQIVRLTEERERTIRNQLQEADKLNAEAKAALEEHQRLVVSAKEQAHELIQQAKAVGEKEREQLLARARKEQEQVLERAKQEIEAERERAVEAMRREAVDLSLAAATKLIQRRLEGDADRKIVEDYISSVGEKH